MPTRWDMGTRTQQPFVFFHKHAHRSLCLRVRWGLGILRDLQRQTHTQAAPHHGHKTLSVTPQFQCGHPLFLFMLLWFPMTETFGLHSSFDLLLCSKARRLCLHFLTTAVFINPTTLHILRLIYYSASFSLFHSLTLARMRTQATSSNTTHLSMETA